MDRRKFLKTSGILGVGGVLSSCDVQKKLSAQTAKNTSLGGIAKEAEKKHSQIFNMSGYAAPKLDKVRVGLIGAGARGAETIRRISLIEGVEINAICDELKESAERVKNLIKTSGHKAEIFAGSENSWQEVCKREDLDLIYITTPWELHAPIAICAMEHGKHVAVEIPMATTVEDCWRMVQTSERTKKHCVMLENCCYDFFELLTINMARNGFFGDIIHAEGAYIHEIGKSLFFRGKPGRSWRLKENMKRNGDLYPTHGMGPVAQIMDINRGNKLDYLVSMSSNDFMMNEYAKELSKEDSYFEQFVGGKFRGNMNTTTIRTIKGQTIIIQHDITTPRPYSRLHIISGTKATVQKYPLDPRIFVAGQGDGHSWVSESEFKKLEEQYNPPIIKQMKETALRVGGHGGMDLLMHWRLIDCLRNGLPVDIDVYDSAAWSVIGPLSEWSVANRAMPIDIPDFTNGNWTKNKPHDLSLAGGGNTKIRV